MVLVVPYIGELRNSDARLLALAEFLGIPCEPLALADVDNYAVFLEKVLPDQCSCFVVNPQVMKEWVGLDGLPADLVSFFLSRFRHLLVHGVQVDAFDSAVVATLSRGRLKSVDPTCGERLSYVIAKDSKHICEAFSGLSFGPADPSNDRVLRTIDSDPAVHHLISIGGQPFMAAVKVGGAEILFVASEDVADLNDEVGNAPLAEYFSRILPHAMALRYVAGYECWRPCKGHASIIIDDPLLRKRYGFLNFESLLHLANQHNFHAAIAFIPHNFRRNSSRITRMFRENAARLSICFHGNDHTRGEFASTDPALLDTLISVAEERMESHRQITGLACDRVMVFPQGRFSGQAMKVLKSHNFLAAVNTVPHPAQESVRLTIGELAQPAVLRYGKFPLFTRKPISQTENQDIAFNLFFGRPTLIVEHHDVFQRPDALIEMAGRINSIAPEVHWSNIETTVRNSVLARTTPDAVHHVRGYSQNLLISNDSESLRRYSIEWHDSSDDAAIAKVLMDGTPCDSFELDDAGLRLSIEVAPCSSHIFSLVHVNVRTTVRNLGLRWNAQAFLRRRLSEIRDNYLSKNRRILTTAKAFQRRFLKV